MLQEYKFVGKKTGVKLLVLGAVHGNEVAGPLACERLVADINSGKIEIKAGELTLVPVANPKAHQKDVRQIDENLNRVIKHNANPENYEQSLGDEVAKKIDACDYLLDIHSTHNSGDVPFSFLDYSTEGNLRIIKAIPVDYVLSGWPEVYGTQDSIQDFSTETYAHTAGKNGVTLECGYHKDKAAIDIAYDSIVNLMIELGMVEGRVFSNNKKIIKMTDIIIKEKEGHLVQNFKHLDFVPKGTIIAKCDDGQELKAETDCYIIIPNHECEVGAEWYYLGE